MVVLTKELEEVQSALVSHNRIYIYGCNSNFSIIEESVSTLSLGNSALRMNLMFPVFVAIWEASDWNCPVTRAAISFFRLECAGRLPLVAWNSGLEAESRGEAGVGEDFGMGGWCWLEEPTAWAKESFSLILGDMLESFCQETRFFRAACSFFLERAYLRKGQPL